MYLLKRKKDIPCRLYCIIHIQDEEEKQIQICTFPTCIHLLPIQPYITEEHTAYTKTIDTDTLNIKTSANQIVLGRSSINTALVH